MNLASLVRVVALLAVGGLLDAGSGTSPRLMPFTKIDGSDSLLLAKTDGGWMVMKASADCAGVRTNDALHHGRGLLTAAVPVDAD